MGAIGGMHMQHMHMHMQHTQFSLSDEMGPMGGKGGMHVNK